MLIVAETLEDMSLSSTSSLDRNDTSQEYMDDFDNLGNEVQTNARILYSFLILPGYEKGDSQFTQLIAVFNSFIYMH